MKFVHIGAPTAQEKTWAGYNAELGVHMTDTAADPFGVEWLKFDANSPMDKAIQTKPHTAFQVDNLDAALEGKKILHPAMSPAPGMRIAFIEHEGLVIELCEMAGSSCGSGGCGG